MSNVQNNKLTLLSHQEEAYNNSIKLMEEKGKSAVIFPTGCGKSFVVLKYILEHPDERILFLSPRNAIKDQMYEYIVRYIGGDSRPIEYIQKEYGTLKNAAKQYIPNIECMLYQTILEYNEKQSIDEVLKKLRPDLIIVDEMHHLKTKSIADAGRSNVLEDELESDTETEEEKEQENKWGNKFKKFLEDNPQAKLLGLSATPIRTDGANVVERIFEDSIASEMSLLEAIEQGIIYPPKYVVPDFVREDELKTLLEKIEQAEGERKEQLKEEYDELVKKSSNALGIPELMEEHITEKDGKYIIFCKDIEDMKEKMAKVGEWFGKIDQEAEIYGIHSKDKTSSEQLRQFNNSTSEHLKLMYCVGMIDEGVHLNNISGVILSAKTGSRPTYLQRIGRGISSGKDKKQATVIDLVNNNEILSDDSKVQEGYGVNDEELLQELITWIDEKNDGKLPDYNAESFKEKNMAKRMVRINNKYLKYVKNEELLDDLNEDKQEFISSVIELGKQIGLFADYIELDLTEEEKRIETLTDSFLEDIEIKGVRRDFREILNTDFKYNNFELIMQFAKENGRIPKPITKKAAEQTEEEKEEFSLYKKWIKTEEKKIVDSYKGKTLEEIPEEHRELVKTIREYGYGITPIEEIIEFAKENGRMPKPITKKAAERTEEEKEEQSLYQKWLRTEERKIVDSYEGKKIEKIPEEYRELVKIIREYGYFGKGKNSKSLGKVVANIPIEQIEEGAEFLSSISKTNEKNKGVGND